MILNPANSKMDQSLSDFQTGIGVTVHAILDMEQPISHTRTSLVDTIASLQHSDGGVLPVQEVLPVLINVTHREIQVFRWFQEIVESSMN